MAAAAIIVAALLLVLLLLALLLRQVLHQRQRAVKGAARLEVLERQPLPVGQLQLQDVGQVACTVWVWAFTSVDQRQQGEGTC